MCVCVCCLHSWSGHHAPGRQHPGGAPHPVWPQDAPSPPRWAPGRHPESRAGQDGRSVAVNDTSALDTPGFNLHLQWSALWSNFATLGSTYKTVLNTSILTCTRQTVLPPDVAHSYRLFLYFKQGRANWSVITNKLVECRVSMATWEMWPVVRSSVSHASRPPPKLNLWFALNASWRCSYMYLDCDCITRATF